MSLSRNSPERQAKIKKRKERWEKGESNLQKAALWIKKKTGADSKSKGILSSAVGRFAEDTEKKRSVVKKKALKKSSSMKGRARMTKVQKKEAERKARAARAKAWREKRAKNKKQEVTHELV